MNRTGRHGPGASPVNPGVTGDPSAEDLSELSEIFAALADPTRLAIIYTIRARERSVGDVAAVLGLSEPLVSQHLRRLRSLRVVRVRQDGRHRFYQLDDEHVTSLLDVALDHVKIG
ncbi:MAG: metalloregulator ArsR/SmtB family transcription factor [Polyangia bacterium]|nr:metalloregulator ArsR/SmtB family transcription factor [Polyangia bacterium]